MSSAFIWRCRGHEGNASRILMKHFQRLSREVASTFVPYLAASSDESGKYSLLDFDAESFLARVRRSAFEGRLPRLASLTGSIDRYEAPACVEHEW